MGKSLPRIALALTTVVAPPMKLRRIWHKWTNVVAAATLLLLSAAPAQARSPADPAASPVEYSLLMPAIGSKYVVATVNDLMTWVALGGHTNSVRQAGLRDLVEKEGYDASSSLAIAMEEELEAAGYRTEVEPVPRARPGQPQRLTRADLPTSPHGLFLLDVVIESIGLVNASNGTEWQPAFKLNWRVMRPSGEIVVPTHVFFHGPFPAKEGYEYSRTTCGLPSYTEAMKRPQVLWDCFDLGLREASHALIPLIREKQDIALHGKPKSVPGAAKTDTEAAAKRKRACKEARRPREALDGQCGAD